MSTITEERTDTTTTDAGDHDRFAHYFPKDKIARSIVEGEPITALCGKVDIPHRDPSKYPVCPTCQEIHGGMPK
jgi:hypothetical protein